MCECSCKLDPKNTPVLIGGLIVYELAVIIILLCFILFSMDNNEPAETVKEKVEESEQEIPCC